MAHGLRQLHIEARITAAVGIAHGTAAVAHTHDQLTLRDRAERLQRRTVGFHGDLVRAEPLDGQSVHRPVRRERLERGVDIDCHIVALPVADAERLGAKRFQHPVAAHRLAAGTQRERQHAHKQQREDTFDLLHGKTPEWKNERVCRYAARSLSYRIFFRHTSGKM